jgi:hypothetical protein
MCLMAYYAETGRSRPVIIITKFFLLVLSLTNNMSMSTSTDGLQVELLILNVIILREQKEHICLSSFVSGSKVSSTNSIKTSWIKGITGFGTKICGGPMTFMFYHFTQEKCLNANDQNLGFRCDLGVTSYNTRKGRAQTDWASNTGRRMKEI